MSGPTENPACSILPFIFASPDGAMEVSEELKAGAASGDYEIIANAVVAVDTNGKRHVHAAGHGGRGAGLGVAAGIAGQHTGRAIQTDDLAELVAEMQPNTSAIVAMVEDTEAEALVGDMKGYTTSVAMIPPATTTTATRGRSSAMRATDHSSSRPRAKETP
jgi:hypothetical protein